MPSKGREEVAEKIGCHRPKDAYRKRDLIGTNGFSVVPGSMDGCNGKGNQYEVESDSIRFFFGRTASFWLRCRRWFGRTMFVSGCPVLCLWAIVVFCRREWKRGRISLGTNSRRLVVAAAFSMTYIGITT